MTGRTPPATFVRDQSHLEAVSLSLGPHSCCCAGGSASSSAHAASTEVSLQSGPVPTERPTGYGAGYQEVVGGPQMVEGARERLKRQQAGSSPASAGISVDESAFLKGRGTSGPQAGPAYQCQAIWESSESGVPIESGHRLSSESVGRAALP